MLQSKSNQGIESDKFRFANVLRVSGNKVIVQERGGTAYKATPPAGIDVSIMKRGDRVLLYVDGEASIINVFSTVEKKGSVSSVARSVSQTSSPGGSVNAIPVSESISIIGTDGILVESDTNTNEVTIGMDNEVDYTGKSINGAESVGFGNCGEFQSQKDKIGLICKPLGGGEAGDYNTWRVDPDGKWRFRNRPEMQHGVDFTEDFFHWHGRTGALMFNLNSEGVTIGLPGSDNQLTVTVDDGLKINGKSIIVESLDAESIGPKLTAYISEIAGENPMYFDATYKSYDGTSPWDDGLLPAEVIIASVLSRGMELWVKKGAYGHTVDETIFVANNEGVRLGSGDDAVTVDPDGNVTIPSDLFVGGDLSVGEAIKILTDGTNWNSWDDPDTADGIVIAHDVSEGATIAGYDDGLLQAYFDSRGRIRWGNGPGLIDMSGIKFVSTGIGELEQRIVDYFIANGFNGSLDYSSTSEPGPDGVLLDTRGKEYVFGASNAKLGNDNGSFSLTDIPYEDGRTITFSTWIKSSSGNQTIRIMYGFYQYYGNGTWKKEFTSGDISVTTEWQRISYTFVTSGLNGNPADSECVSLISTDGVDHRFRLYGWQVNEMQKPGVYIPQFTDTFDSGSRTGFASQTIYNSMFIGEEIHARFLMGKETTPETYAENRLQIYPAAQWGYGDFLHNGNVLITPGTEIFSQTDNPDLLYSLMSVVGSRAMEDSIYVSKSSVFGYRAASVVGSESGDYNTRNLDVFGVNTMYDTKRARYSSVFGNYAAAKANWLNEDTIIGPYAAYYKGQDLVAESARGTLVAGAYAAQNAKEIIGSVILGRYAAKVSTLDANITKVDSSVFVGDNIKPFGVQPVNQIIIGDEAEGVADNSVVIGNNAITDTYLHGDIHTDGKFIRATPSAPTGLTLSTAPGDRVNVSWSHSGDADMYEVWSSYDDSTYNLIAIVPDTHVYDSSYMKQTTLYYKVYAVRAGKRSTAATGSITLGTMSIAVINFKTIQVSDGFCLSWDTPTSRLYDGIEIKMDHKAASGDLDEASATTIYSGNSSAFRVHVNSADADDYYQFWATAKVKT